VGPRAGLDGRKISTPPGEFLNLYICYIIIVINVSSILFFCFVFIMSLSLQFIFIESIPQLHSPNDIPFAVFILTFALVVS